MNPLQHAQFGQIRVEKHKDDFVFCAKDLCEILELQWKGSDSIGGLDEDEKIIKKIRTNGGLQNLIFITESGLYALIIRSNKPMARKFRKWITSEVLPSLRKYGIYSTDQKVMDRAAKRLEDKAVKTMLTEIDSRLSYTDKRLIGKQCLTTDYSVNRVLRGETKDAYMLALCYGRAAGNKVLNKQFYTLEGAEELLNELKKNQ
jgi:prophage antirepressor-like protein